jgi:endonuclease III-like uncharacterized protein
MHSRALIQRDATAQQRIIAAVATLAESSGVALDAEVILSIRNRDLRVQAMLQREALADALEMIAGSGVQNRPTPNRESLRSQLLEIKGVGERVADEVLDVIEDND